MRDPSDYAGKAVRLRQDAAELGGHQAEVVDWYERTGGGIPWRFAEDDPRTENYRIRSGLGGLPDDNDVLFARVDGMGQLIHVTEIEGYTAPTTSPSGPSLPDERAIGKPCPGCGKPIEREHLVAKLAIGPGADKEARAAAKAGGTFACVYVDIHWACRTGDESYEQAEG